MKKENLLHAYLVYVLIHDVPEQVSRIFHSSLYVISQLALLFSNSICVKETYKMRSSMPVGSSHC
jgi:hypothetical protein